MSGLVETPDLGSLSPDEIRRTYALLAAVQMIQRQQTIPHDGWGQHTLRWANVYQDYIKNGLQAPEWPK